MSSRSIDIYGQNIDYLRKVGRILGVDIFDKNYSQFNAKIINVITQIFFFTLTTIYCVFLFKDDFDKLTFCLVTYGFAIQVSYSN